MTRITLPEKTYSGYIFDLDGTLVDSMGLHYRAWRESLAAYGAPKHVFFGEEFVSNGGRAAVDIVTSLNSIYGLDLPAAEIARDKRDLYMRYLNEIKLDIIPETVGLVHQLIEKGIPFAIGTGSAPQGALATLKAAGLESIFSHIVTPEDVPAERGKPCPDIFLLCAERMGVEAKDCVVFEDAQPGIDAAIAAGMDYVFVDSTDVPKWCHAIGESLES